MNKSEFKRILESGRNAYLQANNLQCKIVDRLENDYENINFDEVLTNAENSDNVMDAISCYMQFGEYSIDEIWEEIKNEVNKERYYE